MKYKVGDVVRIISGDKLDEMEKEGIGVYPMAFMIAGLKVEIIEAKDEFYRFNVSSHFMFSEHVIEGLAEPFNKKELKESSEKLKTFKIGTEYYFDCPQGYIFKDENGNVINATKIVLEKKKKEYPKTYEKCREILKEQADVTYGYKKDVLHSLQKLLVCRDAYWKIAGKEMGLRKPWKPNDSSGYCTYAILRHTGHIRKSRPYADSELLEFPTEEMRDAFYENFKEEIEICKELL